MLNTFFKKDLDEFSTKLMHEIALFKEEERPRIFAMAQKDILDTMEDDLDKRANELAQVKLKELLSLIDHNDVIALKGKQVYINGEAADDIKVSNLKSEAEFIMTSEIWKVLNGTPKHLAMNAMFVDDGKLETQLLKGRAILFTLSTQQKIIDILQGLST